MGLREILTGRAAVKRPAARDRLFAMSTAHVTLEVEQGITSAGVAGIVFQSLATSDFKATVADMEAVVAATASEFAATMETREDDYGFSWVIIRDDGIEDLVVAINGVSGALESGGYGERILAAVFAFHAAPDGSAVNFIYNYKRGSWYPFVPAPGDHERSTERELQLKAQIGSELPIEAELERWFPLWGIPF